VRVHDRSSLWIWGFALFTVVLGAIAWRSGQKAGTQAGSPAGAAPQGVDTSLEATAHAQPGSGSEAALEMPVPARVGVADAPRAVVSEMRAPAAPTPVTPAATEPLSPVSGMDAQRAKAADLFRGRLETLSRVADGLDADFQQYLTECQRYRTQADAGPRFAAPHGRDWFVVWSEQSRLEWPMNASCRSIWRQIGQEAASMKQALDGLEEASRRSGVLPGVMRDFRRQYRLSFE
jgi:hypothetical protein